MFSKTSFMIFASAVTFAAALLASAAGFAAEPPAKISVEFRLAQSEAAEGFTEMKLGNQKVWVSKTASLTRADIESAKAIEAKDDNGRTSYSVEVRLTKQGGEKMAALTDKNRNKMLAILIDGKLISAPVIKAKIADLGSITGRFTKEEVESLARRINTK